MATPKSKPIPRCDLCNRRTLLRVHGFLHLCARCEVKWSLAFLGSSNGR